MALRIEIALFADFGELIGYVNRKMSTRDGRGRLIGLSTLLRRGGQHFTRNSGKTRTHRIRAFQVERKAAFQSGQHDR